MKRKGKSNVTTVNKHFPFLDSKKVQKSVYPADVPALVAFLTILVTTVNFVVSVEVNFYPKYKNYYSLFNDKGAVGDITQAGE